MRKQIIFYSQVVILTMVLISISFNSDAQRMPPNQDLQRINVPMKSLKVNSSKFNSEETNRAANDFKMLISKNSDTRRAIHSLRQKRYSIPTIMATVRKNNSASIKIPGSSSTTNTVSNAHIADDVQLMLRSISDLTAVDLLVSVQDLYDATDVDLFNISLLAMQDTFQRMNYEKTFTFQCDCRLSSGVNASSYDPKYANKSMTYRTSSFKRMDYAWACFNYWNTALRNVLLPSRGLNGYLSALRKSQFPLYKGMLKEDLADASINFKTILGNSGDSLYRLMECAALGYQPLADVGCPTDRPTTTSVSYSGSSSYYGMAYFPYSLKPMCRLTDVVPVIKRNGYTITEIAKAVKKRFNPDEVKKEMILGSFDKSIFTNADLLEVARVLNEN